MNCSKYIFNLLTEEMPQIICCLQNEVETSIARIARKEIHRYRWFQGEKGRILGWEEARDEWLEKHYEDFFNYISKSRWGKERLEENIAMIKHKEMSHASDLYVWTEIYKTFQYWSTRIASFLKGKRYGVYVRLKAEFEKGSSSEIKPLTDKNGRYNE